ncbi:chromate transporter [Cuneatibacter caecimuris]|uniref:Chromate transporter n=1 Tax=Cuneatibacter caecimuris TaxID=1796618 RepID=A0A4Q7P5N8_9FIRM|nr:chromate transporter [Cuneatibacter caecimuris]RZS94012.1 chromate transporter [Cuneatibacter caecimuris]
MDFSSDQPGRGKVLLKLFISTFYLSAFTFGGGYVIVTLMKRKFVDEYHWIEEQEMLDLVAIAQSAPGPIAVNGAIVVGYKLAGIPGLLISILATILPPFIILSVISLFYTAFRENTYVGKALAGMQAGVGAVIADVVLNMGRDAAREKDALNILIMAAAFAAAFFLEVNVVYIILACAALGVVRTLLSHRKKVQQ